MKTIRFKKLVFIAFIVLLFISGCGSSQMKTAANKKMTVNKDLVKSPKIGDTVVVGKMVYKVNKVHTTAQVGPDSQVGPSVLPLKAKGKYVVINVTVKNNGDDSVVLKDNFLKLKKGKKMFDTDSKASLTANLDKNQHIKNFYNQNLLPGNKATINIVFDVAPSVASSPNLLLQAQEGVSGMHSALIDLK
ncbi:DUF4352 domain-containing protein [Pullulanibacillus sp. KACC 23026]|uniref:DUF4352 domain-containing protein n=1 Tax=Pullulanibacillus sp. KACC 23026 TaxID=3028315 RepID=UPI0023AECA2B|nr:DUF4352 domain-containing protein [Pullulanibacillus sp. KACC 23026]WEG13206.1 DUF4352 domain-containing protein [Pullulanibacillus sp. KACC 23026]